VKASAYYLRNVRLWPQRFGVRGLFFVSIVISINDGEWDSGMNDFKAMAKQTNGKLAIYFKQFRNEQDLSMITLSEKVGSTKTFIGKCENDGRRIDLGEFLHYCAGLSIHPVELIKRLKADKITLDSVALQENQVKFNLNNKHQTKDFRMTTRSIGDVVGIYLKATRVEAGLTMRTLSEIIKEPHSLIGKIECRYRRIDVGEFIHYCEAMSIEPSAALQNIINSVNKQ
jgi:transcriptional regulator with XRE-family HTH domain